MYCCADIAGVPEVTLGPKRSPKQVLAVVRDAV